MKERPILFQDDMVRAILDNRKIETRRKIKQIPNGFNFIGFAGNEATFTDPKSPVTAEIKCPYGRPSDALWVRETWRPYFDPELYTCVEYRADGGRVKPDTWTENEGFKIETGHGEVDCETGGTLSSWCPSIHLFRCACRITLRIENIKVERVQEITEAGAEREGAEPYRSHMAVEGHGILNDSYVAGFAILWNRINGGMRNSGPFCWAANPFVWVIRFSILEVRTKAKCLTARNG